MVIVRKTVDDFRSKAPIVLMIQTSKGLIKHPFFEV